MDENTGPEISAVFRNNIAEEERIKRRDDDAGYALFPMRKTKQCARDHKGQSFTRSLIPRDSPDPVRDIAAVDDFLTQGCQRPSQGQQDQQLPQITFQVSKAVMSLEAPVRRFSKGRSNPKSTAVQRTASRKDVMQSRTDSFLNPKAEKPSRRKARESANIASTTSVGIRRSSNITAVAAASSIRVIIW